MERRGITCRGGWTGRLADVEYEHELYAERLRRKAQAAALASGEAQWSEQLDQAVRVKLSLAWRDAMNGLPANYVEQYEYAIRARTLRSIAMTLNPDAMTRAGVSNEELLSLVEAEHEILQAMADGLGTGSISIAETMVRAPDGFRQDVNRIFEAHAVGLHLHHNSRLVPIGSHEMHDAVVAPTLYLLHSQPRFSGAETAYQNALKELRNRDPADGITDAATALEDVLLALSCTGNALGPLVKSARSKGLLKGSDTPLTEAICKAVDWVSAARGEGAAHMGNPAINMSDA